MSKSSSAVSRSSKSKSSGGVSYPHPDLQTFINCTQAPPREAQGYLEKYANLALAVDKYFENPHEFIRGGSGAGKRTEQERIQRLNALFDRYKDSSSDEGLIMIEGTIRWCEDMNQNPEDVVFLAVAHELQSPSLGTWTRKGWVDGWKSLGQDTIEGMNVAIADMRRRLASDPMYFKEVYEFTFEILKLDGQRYLTTDVAQGYWSILIPLGLSGGALSHTNTEDGSSGEDAMMEDIESNAEEGWKPEFLEWWCQFLNEEGKKSIPQDTWKMFREFVRSIDSKFENYDELASWPSTMDEFVYWVREKRPELEPAAGQHMQEQDEF